MITITNKEKCSGCHACASICPKSCIEMKADNEGFLYPKINTSLCINCNLCEKVCPIIHDKHNDIKREPIAYAAYNKNEEIRMQSSSGGIFTLIAENIINQNGVVFGACFDENFDVIHDYAENIEDLGKFRTSKYVQSKIGDAYLTAKNFLESGRLVLFTGTPCQIGGLKSFLNKEYDNLICQDIICHGVPSPKVWQTYIDFREKCANSSVKKINFRDKTNSWSKYNVSFLFHNDSQYSKTLSEDPMMRIFLKDLCLRPSCYECIFKNINRQSDITLADFWGVKSVCPEIFDDKGTSLLILNSQTGKNMFDNIKSNVIFEEVDFDKAINLNPAMFRSAKHNKRRSLCLENINSSNFDVCAKKYSALTFSKKCYIFSDKVIGKTKRTLKKIIFSLKLK